MSKKSKVIIIIAAIIILAIIGFKVLGQRKLANVNANAAANREVEYTVKKENISVSVEDSGSVNPTDKRSIKSEIDGTVDGIYITEGDIVEKNQLLISLKSETGDNQVEINDLKLNIERVQRELNNLYENKGSLNIYAEESGVISNMNIKVGDSINSNSNIATIKDTENSYIQVYFTQGQYDKISIGDKASAFMTSYFITESGTVYDKDSTPVQMGGGTFGYLVTVKINNPGGYSVGELAQVTVTNSQGTYTGINNGQIVESESTSVISKVSGKINSINTENGKNVNKGDIIASIEGDDIEFSIEEKQNQINKYQSQIEDLVQGDTVYSPMQGTILQINVSEDEVVDRNTALMTVADLESMEVVIAVDELDIGKIKKGQVANILSDVYPDEDFTGTVTKISMEGTSQNGVTTYDVTIKLDDRKSLMSGMNVDVEILADSREDVLVVPIDAVHKFNGEYMVTIKDKSGNKNDVNVELGLATKDKVEILSGLNEGDVVVYNIVQSQSSSMPAGVQVRTSGVQGAPASGNGGPSGGRRQ